MFMEHKQAKWWFCAHYKWKEALKKEEQKKNSVVFNQNLPTCLIWKHTLQPSMTATSNFCFSDSNRWTDWLRRSVTSHSRWCYSDEFYLCYHWKVISVALSLTDSKTAVALSSYSSDLFWVMINIRPCRQRGYLRCYRGKLDLLKCRWQDKRQQALGRGGGCLLNMTLTASVNMLHCSKDYFVKIIEK